MCVCVCVWTPFPAVGRKHTPAYEAIASHLASLKKAKIIKKHLKKAKIIKKPT